MQHVSRSRNVWEELFFDQPVDTMVILSHIFDDLQIETSKTPDVSFFSRLKKTMISFRPKRLTYHFRVLIQVHLICQHKISSTIIDQLSWILHILIVQPEEMIIWSLRSCAQCFWMVKNLDIQLHLSDQVPCTKPIGWLNLYIL